MREGRSFRVMTPVGADVLVFSRLAGTEGISENFHFELDLLSEDIAISAFDLLGESVSLEIGFEDEEKVYLNGVVEAFGHVGFDRGLVKYNAILRPWLWFLSKSSDNRVFQNLTVVEIIEQVFAAYPVARYELRLRGTYEPIEYCVQYGETDLNFVMRWMEEAGIFFFFEHADGQHTLVLTDAVAELTPANGFDVVLFRPNDTVAAAEQDVVTRFARTARVTTGEFSHTDYDFTKPAADLAAKSTIASEHALSELEFYEYPGGYSELSAGEEISAIRMAALKSPVARAFATTTIPAIRSGMIFSLEDFPREEENDDYAVLSSRFEAWDGQYLSGGDFGDDGYQSELVLIPTSEEFRPLRATRKPAMLGPQTAVVVGPDGDEIFTDEYARVKVQFHWDRLGLSDENSSCFVRVSAAWAGSGYGFIQIPRIGQEVIVDFLEGDPDQPIITGRVYNAAQMPPYELPANATQSGWKSDSSPGGGGFNELRFEDKAGSEEVYFQAQKDHNELIKNDEGRVIGHDFNEEIGNDSWQQIGNNSEQHVLNDRTETVHNDKRTSVTANRTVAIGQNDTETVGGDRSLHVSGSETITIDGDSDEKIFMGHSQYVLVDQSVTVGGMRSDKVGGYESRAVGAWHSTTVAGYRSVTVGAYQKHAVSGNDSTQINGGQTLNVGKNQDVAVKGDQSVNVEGDGTYMVTKKAFHSSEDDAVFRSNKNLLLEAADDSVTIKVGKSEIIMKKDGTITIEGKDLTLDASGKINLKAGGEITLKGSKVNLN